jgi:lysine/ornithine N-monooxygenase
MTSKDLIEQSLNEANQTRVNVERKFIALHWDKLNRKPTTNSWSAAECFQHLNYTNGEYLKRFNEIIKKNQLNDETSITFSYSFAHSFWGKLIMYFVNPKTKMKSKTTKPFNPTYSKVETDVIQKYLFQHDQLFRIVSEMKNLDLRKLKLPSPINARIKYNLGDAIRIIILHDRRHIQQAERAINK